MNKVSTTIKRLRLEKGMNQEQLAEKLHVTRQAVSNWETGKTQPDIEMLTKIAEKFNVSVERLIYGKEIRETKNESGVIRRTWEWGNSRLSLTFFPERLTLAGAMLAMVVSYVNWHSIGWAILHGLLNWGYILYYIIRW
ncbi:MAG: helix-turn-helix domain-containing protein [Clostridia bacterium]|nr:helix-turn-helix domain-containing protein [Clostridia bacterium]